MRERHDRRCRAGVRNVLQGIVTIQKRQSWSECISGFTRKCDRVVYEDVILPSVYELTESICLVNE